MNKSGVLVSIFQVLLVCNCHMCVEYRRKGQKSSSSSSKGVYYCTQMFLPYTMLIDAVVHLDRDNLVLLQVGFKSLIYEMQEQKPAYDSNALFGKEIFKVSCAIQIHSRLFLSGIAPCLFAISEQ